MLRQDVMVWQGEEPGANAWSDHSLIRWRLKDRGAYGPQAVKTEASKKVGRVGASLRAAPARTTPRFLILTATPRSLARA